MTIVRGFAKMHFVEFFSRQLLNPESNIIGKNELEDAARSVLHSVDTINAKKYSNFWSTPPGYPSLQLFLPEVVHFLCFIHKYYSLYRHGRQIPMAKWSTTLLERFNDLDRPFSWLMN